MITLLLIFLYTVGAVGGYWFTLWQSARVVGAMFPRLSTGDRWADARAYGGLGLALFAGLVWPVGIPMIYLLSRLDIKHTHNP